MKHLEHTYILLLESLQNYFQKCNNQSVLDFFTYVGIAYSNDDNSATMSKLTAQGSHDRQATELPVVAALVLSGL